MIYILAGSHHIAQYIARHELGLRPKEWRYVSRAEKLYGIRGEGNSVVFGHGFWDRPDVGEMLALVRRRGFSSHRTGRRPGREDS